MNGRNVKKIILYIIGLIVMAGLFVFILRGVREMLTDPLAERKAEKRSTDVVSTIEDTTEKPTTEATTEITTEEITTEATTELTTEEVELEPKKELTIEDDVKNPIFLTLPQSVEIKQGSPFYILDYVGYADDVDRSPELETEGNVDTSTVGSYPVTLTLTDDAGHTTNGKMTVNVVTEYTKSPEKEKEDFETFQSIYKNDSTSLGIDVSRWQENVDFNAVKNAGCDFVIIRIGGYDDGSQYTDKYFKTNIENAKAAGLKVGIYWHAEENDPEQVKSNVEYLMSVLAGETLDYPIAYDWEDFSHFPKYAMNLYDINYCFETFYNTVRSYGYDACLYSSKNFLENVWTNEKNHPVWLANYTSSTSYGGSYYMWQQANTGRIPGINGDVDFNILYTDRYNAE